MRQIYIKFLTHHFRGFGSDVELDSDPSTATNYIFCIFVLRLNKSVTATWLCRVVYF